MVVFDNCIGLGFVIYCLLDFKDDLGFSCYFLRWISLGILLLYIFKLILKSINYFLYIIIEEDILFV